MNPAPPKRSLNLLWTVILIIIFFAGLGKVFNERYFEYHHTLLQILVYIGLTLLFLFIVWQYWRGKYDPKRLPVLLITMMILLLTLWLLSFRKELTDVGDNAQYVLNAMSILKDGVPRYLYMPGQPPVTTLHNIGISLLILPFVAVFGPNFPVLQALMLLMTAGFVLMVFLVFKDFFDEPLALLVTLVIGSHAHVTEFSYQIMTEIPYLFVVFLSFWLWKKYGDTNKWGSSAGITALVFFSFLIRKAGILFIAVPPLLFLLKKKWLAFAVSSLTLLILFAGYLGYQQHLKKVLKQETPVATQQVAASTSGNFLQEALAMIKGGSFQRIPNTVINLIPRVYPQKLLGDPQNVEGKANLGHLLILLLMFLGLFLSLKKEFKLLDGQFLAIFCALIVNGEWDPVVYVRYTTVVFPLVIFYVLLSLRFLAEKIRLDPNKIVVCVCSLLLVLNLSAQNSRVVTAKYGESPEFKDYKVACEWVKKNTPEGSVLASRKSSLAYFWSGGRTCVHYYELDTGFTRYDRWSPKLESDTLKMYLKQKVDYVILDCFSSDAGDKILPIVQNHQNLFKIIDVVSQYSRQGKTYVLEIQQSALTNTVRRLEPATSR